MNAGNSNDSNFIGTSAGQNATSSPYSNFIGTDAGHNASSSDESNFIGDSAGYSANGTSYANFLGYNAGYSATDADNSNFIGTSAGYGADNAQYSNLIGYQAGMSFTSNNIGNNNIIIGTNVSLPNATTNSLNIGGILFGTGLYSTTSGNPTTTAISGGKIGIGTSTLNETLTVAGTGSFTGTLKIGAYTLPNTDGTNGQVLQTNGSGVVAWATVSGGGLPSQSGNAGKFLYTNGTTASWLNETGVIVSTTSQVTLNGTSLVFASTTLNSYFFGNSGNSSASGQYNTGVGSESLQNITSGNRNTAIGFDAMQSMTTGSYNIAIGHLALNHSTSSQNNVAIGPYALDFNTIGTNNIAIGNDALGFNIDGNDNVGLGVNSLAANTSGSGNLALGTYALQNNLTGLDNVAIGYQAINSATSSSDNVGLGSYALQNTTSGQSNVAVGRGTLRNNTTGGSNSGIGLSALYNNSTGYNNTAIGYQAGDSITTGHDNILIGYNVDVTASTSNNQLNIGNTIYGDLSSDYIGIATSTPQYTLDVGNSSISGVVARFTNSSGNCTISPNTTSLTCSSDINLKKNIDLVNTSAILNNSEVQFVLNNNIATSSLSVLDKLLILNPVSYNWKIESSSSSKHTGFIAQEVEQLFSDLVSTDPGGLKGVNYGGFTPYIVASLKSTFNTLNGSDSLLTINSDATNTIDLITNENNIDVLQTIHNRLSSGYELLTNLVVLRISAIRGYFVKLYSDLIETKKLCLINENGQQVCTNANQLQELLNTQNSSSNSNTNTSGGSEFSSSSDNNGSTTLETNTDNGTTTPDISNGSSTTETNSDNSSTTSNTIDDNFSNSTETTSESTSTPDSTPTTEPQITPESTPTSEATSTPTQ